MVEETSELAEAGTWEAAPGYCQWSWEPELPAELVLDTQHWEEAETRMLSERMTLSWSCLTDKTRLESWEQEAEH